MNERIKQLAEQATSIVDVKHEGYRGKGYTEQVEFFDKEKFAELLIREYSYDVMNLHGAKPERVQYAAKCWGVEV